MWGFEVVDYDFAEEKSLRIDKEGFKEVFENFFDTVDKLGVLQILL